MLFVIKSCNIVATFHCQKVVFTQRRKGGTHMTSHDTIINLVDKLLAEKDKNLILQMQLYKLQNQQESEMKYDQK